MTDQKQFLKPAEIAPMLGLTTGRIYQMIAAGELPATRVGRAIRVPRAAWERWLELQSEMAFSAAADARKRGNDEDR
jgi:excisionase family DNA binding protein